MLYYLNKFMLYVLFSLRPSLFSLSLSLSLFVIQFFYHFFILSKYTRAFIVSVCEHQICGNLSHTFNFLLHHSMSAIVARAFSSSCAYVFFQYFCKIHFFGIFDIDWLHECLIRWREQIKRIGKSIAYDSHAENVNGESFQWYGWVSQHIFCQKIEFDA